MTKTIITQTDNKYFIKDHIYYIEQEKGCIAVAIDLTLMFGKGNEPTDINDQRIKDLEYKPYEESKEVIITGTARKSTEPPITTAICPHCNGHHTKQLYGTGTCNNNRNSFCLHYKCLDCGKEFDKEF